MCWSFSIAFFSRRGGYVSAANCCIETSVPTCSLWNTSTHKKMFGWDLPTNCRRQLCQTSKWLFVHSPSVLYKFHSAVCNVPAIHVVLKYVMNSLILGSSGVSAFMPCHARRTKQIGTKTRAAVLHMNYFSCSIFSLYWICRPMC